MSEKPATKRTIDADFLIGGAHKMPFSQARRAGDFVFVSGTTAIDRLGQAQGGNISVQTRFVLEAIRDALRTMGCEMSDVVKTTCWLEDPRDFWNFNRIFAEFFPTNPPTRSALQSGLMLEGKVEIEAIAYKPL
jgi:reactive intermediate/imine deaminase